MIQSEQHAREELAKLKDVSAASSIQNQRAEVLKGMEAQLKSLQKKLNAKKTEDIEIQSRCNGILVEIETLRSELSALRESLKTSEGSRSKCLNDEAKLESQLIQKRMEYENIKNELSEMANTFNKYNSEMKAKNQDKENKLKEIQTLSLECRKLTHKLECWKKDIHVAQRRVRELEEEYPWISDSKQFFGLPKSDFDFTGLNLKDCQERLHGLKSTQEKLSKKVNKKVMGMIDKAEAESEDLMRKKEVISSI